MKFTPLVLSTSALCVGNTAAFTVPGAYRNIATSSSPLLQKQQTALKAKGGRGT